MKRKGNGQIDLEAEFSKIDIVENPIDLSVQNEYQDLSDSIGFDNVNYEEILTEADRLFVRDTPIEAKKRILILLAHFGTMESAKILERYFKTSEDGLNDWAILSLKECRMFLESVLLKEEGGFVSTGLGGKDNKLRYSFIVSTREGRTLTKAEREELQEAFKGSSDEYDSEIEEINFEIDYAMMGILVPMHVAVGAVIEEGIRRCNRMAEVLSVDYYVTNVKKPGKDGDLKYLKDIGQHEK